MSYLRYSLLAEGPSDQALLPILDWFMGLCSPGLMVDGVWADVRRLKRAPSLSDRILLAIDTYPCELLFVHRDADARDGTADRIQEIEAAVAEARRQRELPIVVSVIPIRMLETWLLIDAQAIRWAAGRPGRRTPLQLPHIHELEDIPNPKQRLKQLVLDHSGLTGRKRDHFQLDHLSLAEHISDFSPLLRLSAIERLKTDIESALMAMRL